jgi:oxalate decarboxylase/phosphoglucose isomerase-like protein (cupin superfamily)
MLTVSPNTDTERLAAQRISSYPELDDAAVPAGAKHNIINTGSVPLKLYTLYAPPNHRDGVVHHTRADVEADNEHFDGKTTE